MALIGELVVALGLNYGKWSSGLSKIEKDASSSFQNIAKLADSTLGKIGITASAGGIAAYVESALDGIAALNDLSQQTGVAVDKLSALQRVAQVSGVSIDDVSLIMQRLSKNMYDAYSGADDARSKFAALGLSATDTAGRLKTPDAMLLEISKKLATFSDGAAKNAVEMDLLGKSGATMGNYLADLADTQQLVGNRTAEQAQRADDLQKAFRRVSQSTQDLAGDFALSLIPALDTTLKLVKAIPIAAGAFGAVYFGIPLAVKAYATLAEAVTVATLAFKISPTWIAGMNVALYGTTLAARAAAGAVGLIQVAAAPLIALFAGWQIGKILTDNFLEANLAGIAFVSQTMKGWEYLKFGFEVMIAGLGDRWAWLMDKLGTGVQLFSKLLPGPMSLIANAAGGAMKSIASNPTSIADLAKQRDANIAADQKIFDEMVDDAIARFNKTQSSPVAQTEIPKMPGTNAKDMSDTLNHWLQQLNANIQQEQKLLNSRESALKTLYDNSNISIADYYNQRAALIQDAAQKTHGYYLQELADVQAYQSHFAKGTTQYKDAASKIITITDAMNTASDVDANNIQQNAEERTKALEDLARKVTDINAQYQAMIGNKGAAAGMQFDAQNSQTEKLLSANGQTQALAQMAQMRQRAVVNASTDWSSGLDRASFNLLQSVQDIASQVDKTFTDAFSNMEDALVNFAMTGKMNFKSMVNSIIEDLIRMMIRYSIEAPIIAGFRAMMGLSGGSSDTGSMFTNTNTSVLFGGGTGADNALGLTGMRAAGGPVNANGTYLVGEKGPEILRMNSASGNITPNSAIGGQTNHVSIEVNLNGDSSQTGNAQSDGQNAQLLGTRLKNAVLQVLIDEKRHGGLLAAN